MVEKTIELTKEAAENVGEYIKETYEEAVEKGKEVLGYGDNEHQAKVA